MVSAQELKAMRQESGLTQAELAESVGVSQSYIARMECSTLDPKHSVVERILDVLTSRRIVRCSEIMKQPVTVDARSSVASAIKIMRRRGFSQLPIMRGPRLQGLLTERDIIRNLSHDLTSLSAEAIMGNESPPIVDEDTQVNVILPLFDHYQAVLVAKKGRLTGIISRTDILRMT
jgi:predicted transcriptional regulator